MTDRQPIEVVRARLLEVTSYAPSRPNMDWRCPAHDDSTSSLSLSEGADGRVLLHCHAGCDVASVLERLRLEPADLFPDDPERRNGSNGGGEWTPRGDAVAVYDYVDEDGRLLFQVLRTAKKEFPQRRPDPSKRGGWAWRLDDTRRVLYRLPRVVAAAADGEAVFVCEGEKDVQSIEAAGAVATCNPGGAGKWADEYARVLQGARVIVVADRDQPGRRHARRVAASLTGVAASVRIVEAAEGKDATDHLRAGRTLEELLLWSPEEYHEEGSAPPTDPKALQIVSAADFVTETDAMGSIGWLAKSVWPADAYGVVAAEQKAGKTWAILDLVVSVASGTPWMGRFDCDEAGPVLVFLGEGGKRKMRRRFDAVCRQRGLALADLPVRLCFRAPHLTSARHMEMLAAELGEHRPRLVIVDPLYLAARGAKGSQLYEMGEHLAEVQAVVQEASAALVIVHHWNKTGEGKGAKRMSGVGPGEWGRVLGSASVRSKSTDDRGATTVILDWQFEGDEIPDIEFRIRRRVWAEDRDDLDSPMHYEIDELPMETDDAVDDEHRGLAPSARRVLAALKGAPDWLSVTDIGDRLAGEGTPLKKRTIQAALKALHEEGLVEPLGGSDSSFSWRLSTGPGAGSGDGPSLQEGE